MRVFEYNFARTGALGEIRCLSQHYNRETRTGTGIGECPVVKSEVIGSMKAESTLPTEKAAKKTISTMATDAANKCERRRIQCLTTVVMYL